VLFTYCHLADKTNYLNHYYLVSLLLGLTAAIGISNADATQPAWKLWLIRFQIGLVYFYGGVGKLESDWLVHAMPLQIWLAGSGDFPVLGPVLRLRETAWIMSWVGAAFDLTAPFLLAQRRTRIYAYAVVVFFHLMTARLFQIGMFPWVMIAVTLVFFDPSWPRRWFSRWLPSGDSPIAPLPRWVLAWVVLQVLYPLRSHLYPGNVLWTEDGYRFSWRVMLIEKAGSADFTVTQASGAKSEIRVRDWLTPLQVKMMSTQPDMIRAFAWMIADDAVRKGQPRPRVTADVVVTLNGRAPARLVDPNVDLAAEPLRLGGSPWVLPSPQ
jgi:vitamin K-dependent gamma-carboxylase